MQIYQRETYEDMSKKAASLIAAQVVLKPDSVLGLATGSSPIGTYESLIERFRAAELDFSQITSFNLDEYYGLPSSNDQSYRYFMHEYLFDHINIEESSINFLNGMASDPAIECARYEEKILQEGGIDMQLLGIGHNGHIAFNEPSSSFEKATFQVNLTQSTIEANKRFFASIDDVPKQALTMGIGTIMAARKIVVVVAGEDKADAVLASVEGPITPEVPASILQLHSDVVLVGDKAALSKLSNV